MKNVKMLQQRVLVAEKPQEVAVGKLVIPESVTKNLTRGIIVAVDEGKLRVGDEILFDNRQALPVCLEDKDYFIVHETQVLAVFNKESKTKKTTN